MSLAGIMAGAAYIKLTMNDAQAMQALDRTKSSLKSFASAASAAGDTLTLVAAPLSAMIDRYIKFSDTMLQVKAVSDASGKELASLRKQAQDLGRTTAFTSTQVAQGMTELARMGFSAHEVSAAIRPAMNLVRSTGEEMWRLGEFSEYTASILRIFNLSAKDFGRVADVMAMAANKSSVDIADLGMSLKIAGPAAKAMGASLESTTSLLMTLADTGIRGSEAGTMLRRVFQAIAEQSAEGKETAKHLRDMGIALKTSTGKARSARDIFVDLSKKMQAMSDIEKVNFTMDVFDLRGSAAALNLVEFSSKLKGFENDLKKSAGYAERKAKEMELEFGGAVREMKSALMELSNAFSEVWAKNLQPFVFGITDAAKSLEEFIKNNSVGLGVLTKFMVTVGGLGVALKTAFAVGKGASAIYEPIRQLDAALRGSKEASAAASAATESKLAAAAEDKKVAAVKRTDAIKQAVATRSELREKQKAVAEAQAVIIAEKQKLAAIKERYAAEAANNQKNLLQQSLDTKGVLGKGNQDKIAKATAAVAEQEKSVNNAVATMLAERKKLASLRQQYVVDASNNQKQLLQQSLDTEGVLGKGNTPEYTAAAKSLADQQKAVAKAQAAVLAERKNLVTLRNQLAAAEANVKKTPVDTPEFTAAAKAMADQEKVVNKAVASTQKLAEQEKILQQQMQKKLAAVHSSKIAYQTSAKLVDTLSTKETRRIGLMSKMIKLNQAGNLSESSRLRLLNLIGAAKIKDIALSYQDAGASKTMALMKALAAKTNYALAASFKALGAAIAANPIGAVLTAISLATMAISYIIGKIDEANAKALQLAQTSIDKAKEKEGEGLKKRQAAKENMRGLKQLAEISKETELTVDQMREAENIIKDMDWAGASQWAKLDKTAKKLTIVKDKMEELTDASAVKNAIADKENTIATLKKQIEEIQYIKPPKHLEKRFARDKEFRDKYYKRNLNDEEKQDLETWRQELIKAQGELKKFKALDMDAIYGLETTQQERNDAREQKRLATANELKKAKEDMLKMEQEIADSGKTSTQKEIDAINKKYDAALDYYKMAGASEKQLERLETWRNTQILAAYRKRNDEWKKYEADRNAQAAKQAEDNKRWDWEQKLKKLQDKGKNSEAVLFVKQEYDRLKNTIAEMTKKRDAMERSFQMSFSEEGVGLGNNEKKQLSQKDQEIFTAAARAEELRRKMLSIGDDMAKREAQQRTATIGGWSAKNLAMALGGGTAAEQTAYNTKEMTKLQKKANKALDEMKKNNSMAYGV